MSLPALMRDVPPSIEDLVLQDRPYEKLEGLHHIEGRICLHVERQSEGDDKLLFIFDDASFCVMMHHQDCCEDVSIEDINGDLNDLVDEQVHVAEERTQEGDTSYGSETYTFYCLRTLKGSIDIRWHGESNGYYSEGVNFDIVRPSVPLSGHDRTAFMTRVRAWRAQRKMG